MEVHHHPDLHHKKKNFKEYFLEFSMIFLAVTMGFFAESIRENISNYKRVEFLTEQLVKDMQSDTLKLQKVINYETGQMNKMDTLFFLLQKPIEETDTKVIQQLIADSWSIHLFYSSPGARLAIEKELNIKQFSSSQIPELIADYEGKINLNKEGEALLLRMGERDLETFFFAHFTPLNAYKLFNDSVPIIDNKMRNITQNDFDELSVKLEVMKALIFGSVQNEQKLKDAAVNIIAYVRKQYKVE